ncbi:Hypothetical predicted protein [Mytilus galloprovincialis]|uniref:Integrase catalytic domain-containing protein n=1 Tax=Mytilus galloprovincialis TaxID=29158 RepID=A0A8B6HRI4_MYTGA|nr:Hypothetical predicted protein [Mytilus galloprovincialis]
MKIEQSLDIELSEIINQINTGKASRSVDNKHIIINDILYYISHPDDDLKLRLYVPLQLRNEVIKSYHDNLSHLGIDKCHDSIRQKYFWPKLYKELNSYINSCVICQSQSASKTKPLLQISDIPPFPFAKIGVDLSGPYPTSLSGNKYIVSFVCHYSGWPLAFPVPNKTSENVVHLLIEEIIPNFSVPLVIVSDNGGEFTSKIFEETLKELNTSHITTSFYHPQGNAKVERFHRTLHDVMAKKLQSDASTWDVCLNQTIAAIRFQKKMNQQNFLHFFFCTIRDPVLPIDNLLKPRRKYVGEDPHKILLEQQHKSFILVHRNLKKSKEKQKQNADKNRQEINLEIGDPVYFKNHLRKNGSVATKVHLEHLKKAKIDEWVIPTNLKGRQLRKTNYVVPPEDSDESDSELPVANPRERLINRYRQERETSSDEDDIPLAELKQKIANRNRRENEEDKSSVTSGSSEMSDNNSSDGYNSDRSQKMSVDEPREFSNREVQIVTRYLGGDQMVSTNVEGDGTASRDVKIASAPLLEPATKNHYPVLDIGFDYWTQRRRLDVHKTIRSHNLYWQRESFYSITGRFACNVSAGDN